MRQHLIFWIVFVFFCLCFSETMSSLNQEPCVFEVEGGKLYSQDRQGGDTIGTSFIIGGLPFFDSGTTIGFEDDYEASCPYASPAPDVVYSFTPAHDLFVTIDLCGSQYNTQLFVLNSELNVVACSSDFYPYFQPCLEDVSRIESCALFAGETYYIVVDGYTFCSGYYEISITEDGSCQLSCSFLSHEGEPPLFDGYVDTFNSGCSTGNQYFQNLVANPEGVGLICGISGWYFSQGQQHRDRDFFRIVAGPGGAINLKVTSEYSIQVMLRDECGNYDFIEGTQILPCQELNLSVALNPFQYYWVYVTPVNYSAPEALIGNEFEYSLEVHGLESGPVSTQKLTLDALKAHFR